MTTEPSYLTLFRSGELAARVKEAYKRLTSCTICPHHCGVNRLAGEKGFCRGGELPAVSSYGPHFGEEAPLVGFRGSGTIFFTYCNMKCVYCQNYELSWLGIGKEITPEELAGIMLLLQDKYGCHNINLVSPTHFVPQILAALEVAAGQGLRLPLVYNCGGYEDLDTLRLLEGIVDIYMPDLKYSDPEVAKKYSGVADYPRIAQEAIREMHRQVGDLVLDGRGIAVRGLLVRHLVLPEDLAGTEECMKFLATVSPEVSVNIMAQYRPENKARFYPPLARRITAEEYHRALEAARRQGLKPGYRL